MAKKMEASIMGYVGFGVWGQGFWVWGCSFRITSRGFQFHGSSNSHGKASCEFISKCLSLALIALLDRYDDRNQHDSGQHSHGPIVDPTCFTAVGLGPL